MKNKKPKIIKEELLPCPFCGNNPSVHECIHQHNGEKGAYTISGGFYVECEECTFQFGHNQDYDEYGDATTNLSTKEEAIRVWNNRAEVIK